MTVLESAADFNLRDECHIAFNHFWTCHEPFVTDQKDVREIVVPDRRFYEEYGCGARQRVVEREVADQCALIGDCDTATMAFLVTMRGMERALFDLIENPDLVHAIMEKGVAIAAERGKFNADLGMNVLRINDSVGNMSVISPAHWREFVFPHLRDLCTELHRYAPAVRLYCHICGDILPIVDDLVAAGLDCIAPLDPLGGFTPADVRARVGASVPLMGGVNTLTLLNGLPTDVESESRRCIERGGGSGAFILGSGCVVPPDSPVENVRAMVRGAERYGRYRDGALVNGTFTSGASARERSSDR
jgi:uroporphyrinogen-III decarboxylase